MTLSTVLIGSHARIGDLRSCLKDLSVQVLAEYPDVAHCMRSLPVDPARKSFFTMDVNADADIGDLQHLSTQYREPCLAALDVPSTATESGMAPMWKRAMRAGASQLVGRPLDIADMSSAISCLGRMINDGSPPCTVIAVTGTSGGSGATTMAINLAHELAHLTDSNVILTEQEEHMSMLASYLDLKPNHSVADLMKMATLEQTLVEQTLVPYGEKLRVLCGHSMGHNAGQDSPEAHSRLLNIMRGMCQFLVYDVSCTLSPSYFDLLAQADRVVVVAEQTLPAMRNLRLLQDALKPMQLEAPLDVIVNKFDSRVSGFSLAGIKDVIATENIWTVENSPTVALRALNLGKPMRLHSERAAIVEDVSKIARSIATAAGCTSLKPPESSRFFNFFRRLA